MAVNGVEIEVGQTWRTKAGDIVTIDEPTHTSESHPVLARSASGRTITYTLDGAYSKQKPTLNDLLELVSETPAVVDPAGDFMGVSVKGGIAPERRDTPSALAVQVGGTHYKDFAIQPVEYIHANNLGFCEGNVVKYITRHAAKNGADDIRKVIHYCQLLLELQYGVKKEGV